MICEEKTPMQLLLEGSVEKSAGSQGQPKNSERSDETENLEAARKRREHHQAWKKANPDKVKAKNKKYYRQNRERILQKERDRWHKKFGPPKHVFGRSEEEKRELTKERQRRNYLANREARVAYAQKQRAENPDKAKQDSRKRYASLTVEQRRKEQQEARARRLAKDPDCDRRRNRERYKKDAEHRSKIRAANEQWKRDNPDKYRKIAASSRRKLIQKDPSFKIRCLMTCRIHAALRGELKRETTMALLGCTREEFKAHLEARFQPGMTWDNLGIGAGTWQIDHVVPIDQHDLSTLEGQKAAFSYLNTQPLWYEDHLKKSASEETGWRRKPACSPPPEAALSTP